MIGAVRTLLVAALSQLQSTKPDKTFLIRIDLVANSMKQNGALAEHRHDLSVNPASHPVKLRMRRAPLYAAQFSHPFFSAFHRSVRVPPGLARDGLCCNSA
jgi:hypothetical protein